jgi:hypothetical protein
MPWGPPDRTNPRVLADPVERSGTRADPEARHKRTPKRTPEEYYGE